MMHASVTPVSEFAKEKHMPALLLMTAIATLLSIAPAMAHPPEGPLERVDPRVYDISMEIALTSELTYSYLQESPRVQPGTGGGRPDRPFPNPVAFQRDFGIADGRIAFPFIFEGQYSSTNEESVHGLLQIGTGPEIRMGGRFVLEEGQPFATHVAVIPTETIQTRTMRFRIEYRVQVWASRLNEAQAAQIPWPEEWPATVQDGLRAEPLIEMDDPAFAAIVERVSEGRLRMVTPYVAAKELVRWCTEEFNSSGSGQLRGGRGMLVGMDVVGARETLNFGRGTAFDLVCVCVAVLRAAGIPARPVIGLTNVDDKGNRLGRTEFTAWAEFYLPRAGWIPFDPAEMQGKGLRSQAIDRAWPGFGTMRRLNRRIPVSYTFVPANYNAPQAPSLWGWQASAAAGSPAQIVRLDIASRGTNPADLR